MAKQTVEHNFTSNINFKLDINKIYSEFLKEIDNVRSVSSISNPENKKSIDEIISKTNGDITSIAGIVKAESTPQESRCHAFYRLIGFPVVSKDFTIYNPGFDIVYDETREKRKNTKLTIAREPIANFNQFSVLRENYPLATLSIFSTPDTVDAGVLALLSGGTHSLRRFSTHLERVTDPFNVEFKNQTYVLDPFGRVGLDDSVWLTTYKDSAGNPPKAVKVYITGRAHLICPFIVDARIDLSVNPPNNLVAVPFVSDRNQLKISSGDSSNQTKSQIDKSLSRNPSLPSHVRRPLLEKIIRQRFAADNAAKQASTHVDSIANFVKDYPYISNLNIINTVNRNEIYNPSEQAQFIVFMQIIASMAYTLAQAEYQIKEAQSSYYWLPKPSKNGPEEGVSTRGLFLPTIIGYNLQTKLDADIIKAITFDILNSQGPEVVNADAVTVDVGHFAFDNFQQTFHPETSGAFGNINIENKENLLQKRTRVLNSAGNALRIIEIIMGEFSGLGLSDIIAIIGALYIIDKNDLLGLLDEYALARMDQNQEFKGVIANRTGYKKSMENLLSAVKDFYGLMDAWYYSVKSGGIRNNMQPGQ